MCSCSGFSSICDFGGRYRSRRPPVVGRVQPESQTKESARRDGAAWLLYGHMFLLYDPRPYVSIMWRSAICFYCVGLGHMFLLCVCMCIYVCVCVYVYVCVYVCVCVCVYVCVCVCV